MNRVMRRTWLPTLLFVILTVGVGWWLVGGKYVAYSAVVALLLTPTLWSRLAESRNGVARGRAAIVGSCIAGFAQVTPSVAMVAWRVVGGRHVSQMDQAMGVIGFMAISLVAFVAAAAGAAVGALLVSRGNAMSV